MATRRAAVERAGILAASGDLLITIKGIGPSIRENCDPEEEGGIFGAMTTLAPGAADRLSAVCQRVMVTLRALVSAARPKVS